MKRLYLRWGGILAVGFLIVILSAQRYYRDVYSLTPDLILSRPPFGTVRILGMVEAGTLVKETPSNQARFSLSGNGQRIPVLYQGNRPDDLRELKTLVVIGQWDGSNRQFLAHEMDLIPNYGFITTAYLIMLPMGLFLFMMEHRVLLLYNKIKESKIYEPEVGSLDEG
ncbi:MAG: cytochrome c maturation protein CcmE [Nitrospirae bacterium]|nr:cytochrome c maturation protein CcmE [Nitrospirota bacterium]